MSALLVAGLALSATVADSQLSASERWPLAVVVLNPRSDGTRASVSDVRASLSTAVERHTDLFVAPLDPALDRCGGRFSCLAPAILATGAEAREAPKLALIVSVVATEHADQVVTFLVDLERADQTLRSSSPSSSPDELDAALSAQAVLARPAPRQLRALDELDSTVEGLVRELTPAWRAAEATSTLGSLVVDIPGPGLVTVDGRPLGEANGSTMIEELRPGVREIQLDVPGFETVRLTVDLSPGARLRLHPAWQRSVRGAWARIRAPHAWTAAIAVAVGSSLLAYSAVDTAGLRSSCIRRDETQGCPVGSPVRLLPASDSLDDRGAGPLTAGLGLSLAMGGVGVVASELVFNDREDAPWWLSVATGFGLAVLSYGLAEAVTAATTR